MIHKNKGSNSKKIIDIINSQSFPKCLEILCATIVILIVILILTFNNQLNIANIVTIIKILKK